MPESLVGRYVERYGTGAEELLKQTAVISPTGYWTLDEYSPEEIAISGQNERMCSIWMTWSCGGR